MEGVILSIHDLQKNYGPKAVLKGVSLQVKRGEIIGYIGANGAGKSTTIKIMLGIETNYTGEVKIFGQDISNGDISYKRKIGYVPEIAEVYDNLTGHEYLTFIGELYGLDFDLADYKAKSLMELFGIGEVYHSRIASYSKGMRQKLLIISSLLHNPELIFFDEPINGLDANSVMIFKEIMTQLAAQGKTIFYSSHIMDVVEKISSRIILLMDGKVVADGSFDELKEQNTEGSLEQIFNELTGFNEHKELGSRFVSVVGGDVKMQDYRTLKILDRFEKVFSNLGVDYKVMRKILQVKLTMDGRRVPTIFSQNPGKQVKETTNQYIKSLWIYVLFSLFLIPFILLGDHYLFQMSIFYGIFTIFIMTSLISDFSSVLLDIRDRNILYPKPVDRRTISTAKMIHVFIYLSFLTVALVGIPLMVGLIRHGIIFFILSLVNIIFIDLLIVILTAFIYMFILRFFDGEKLKDIINYVQIGLSLGIMVGYQLLVRSFDFFNFTVSFEPKWWQIFIFPMWYGANTELVMNGNIQRLFIVLAILSVLMPLISIWIYIKLNHAFEQNLQKLTYHGKAKVRKRSIISQFIMKIICPTKEERSFFRFASLMMKNERDFKLKVYPSLGFSIVIPFLFFISGINNDFEQLSKGNSYFSIYFSLIIIPTIILLLKFSGKYKGAWIYKAAPIQQLKPMFSAVIKAFLVKLYLPVYAFLSVIFIFIFGVRILPDLVVVFINASIFAVLCFKVLPKTIPFSESFDQSNQNSNTATILGLMLVVAMFTGLHYVSTLIHFGIYFYLVIAIVGLALLWKVAFNISWEKVEGV